MLLSSQKNNGKSKGLRWFKSTFKVLSCSNLLSDFYGSKTGIPSTNPERLAMICVFKNGGGEVHVVDHVSSILSDSNTQSEIKNRLDLVDVLCETVDVEFETEKKHVIERRNIAGLYTCGPRGVLGVVSSNPCFFTLVDVEEEEDDDDDEEDEDEEDEEEEKEEMDED